MKMTQSQLVALLTKSGTPRVRLANGRVGYLQAVLREDGSGRSFMLTMGFSNPSYIDTNGQFVPASYSQETIHVRTTD